MTFDNRAEQQATVVFLTKIFGVMMKWVRVLAYYSPLSVQSHALSKTAKNLYTYYPQFIENIARNFFKVYSQEHGICRRDSFFCIMCCVKDCLLSSFRNREVPLYREAFSVATIVREGRVCDIKVGKFDFAPPRLL